MAPKQRLALLRLLILVLIGVGLLIYNHYQSRHIPTPSPTTPTHSTTAPETTNAQCHMHGSLPDPTCTPGATNPDVTQANIQQTICVQGYTKTIRPPASYTDQLKRQQMVAYGFTDNIRSHEEDHLVPLELGGAPQDPHNLWPEPGNSPNPKDKVEDFLHTAVCEGRITLQDAQTRIKTDWTTAENGL